MTDSNIQIRLAGVADKNTVTSVFRDAGLDTDATLESGTTYWVLERGGQPVGAVGLEHGDGVSLLRGAAVIPSARGSGLGRRLIMSALQYAQGRGDRAIYMFSKGQDSRGPDSKGPDWGTFGFQQVPLAVVMSDMPDAPQIQAYKARGERPGGTTWMRDLTK